MPDEKSKPSRLKQAFANYISAFNEELNLIGLAGVIGFSAITWSWVPLLLGLGAECLYLLFFPDSKFYKGMLKVRYEKEAAKKREELKRQWLSSVSAQDRSRFNKLESLRNSMNSALHEMGDASSAYLMMDDLKKMDYLLLSFLRLLYTSNKYRAHLLQMDEGDIKQDIKKMTSQLSTVKDDQIKEVMQKNLDILQKRLKYLDGISQGFQRIDVQLQAIEDAFHLVYDQIVAMRSPGQVSADLDSLVTGVESTEEVFAETAPLAEQIERLQSA